MKHQVRSALIADAGPASRVRLGVNLRFAGDLEAAYRRDHATRVIPMQRLVVPIAAAMYLLYFGVEALVGGGPWAHPNWPLLPVLGVLLGLCIPVNLLITTAGFVPRLHVLMPKLAVITALTNGVGLTACLIMIRAEGLPSPMEGLIVQLLFVFFLLGLSFREASAVGVVILGSYGIGHLALGVADGVLLMDLFFLSGVVCLGSVSGYLHERTDRALWLQTRRLRELSERDSLTGLYNYRIFFERGESLLRQAQRDRVPVSVVMVDLDHFKRFNDSHGHLAGDDCLRRVAPLLDGAARRPLDVVARLGGEEFALLFYGTPVEAALERAENLRQRLAELVVPGTGGSSVQITASLGVAASAQGGGIERLMARADDALYKAKNSGRNRVCA